MKARALLGLALVFAAMAFWIGACVSTVGNTSHDTTHNVVIRKGTIVLPGTEISQADHEAMNKILRHYDKALYRIDTYQDGQRQKTQGKLTDLVTDRTLASEIAVNVKRKGFTRDVHQVGLRDEPEPNPSPAPGGNPSPLKAPNTPTLPTPTPIATEGDPPTASPSPGGNPSPLKPPNSMEVMASPSPGGNPNPLRAQAIQSQQLVDRLRPILEKYSRR